MVAKVIRDYMEGGAKKLTVPGFGTFMRRDAVGDNAHGGEVIFVDLLRGDDHVLSEMVEDRGGYSELEAMAVIDRFIFETKNAIGRRGSATIAGFGTMTLDHKGVYQFDYAPAARPARKETAVQERLFGSGEAGPHPSVKTDGNENKDYSSHRGLKPSNMESRNRERDRKTIPSAEADRSVRRTSAKGFSQTSQGRGPAKRTGPEPRTKKLSPTDTILIVAIAAAAIALIALVFGMSSGNVPFLSK